ncbi:MAG TPA: hypothetical protein VEI07_11500 [Planctomycetaceae bacterium]|nr:hypothetical protein [Planctomycetaceae bacterium]
MSRPRSILSGMLLKLSAALAVLAFATAALSSRASAEEATVKARRTLKLDSAGNADTRLEMTLPTNLYTRIKAATPNMAVLLRRLGAGRNWAVMEKIDGSFNDMESKIDIHYTQRGVARIEHGNQWAIPFPPGATAQLVDIHDTIAIYQDAGNSSLGLGTMIIRLECPAGSTNLKNDLKSRAFVYEYEPKVAQQGKVDASFSLDNKEAIMSCLAKCYSNEQIDSLWAARSRFDNTGSATLTDYKVRFRIAGFSSWGPWHHTSKIYPGQLVVDAYYPVLDFEKLNGVTGPRPAMLETEYEYRRPDGEKVAETESRRLDVLGYNQTIFSGLPLSEILNFSDRMEYMPVVMASFTTPSDPVIQELAGRVSGRADGAAAAANNTDAVKFLRAFYEFLSENKVAYQTPPTYVNGAQIGQHIKYGRDVLRNHAGTCIDLAILWGSTCEAVGLRPVLMLISGHCFPAVYLPEGQLVAIEATAVGKYDFEKAVEIGMQELQQARQGEYIEVDILAQRKAGIQSLDLPTVSPLFLTQLGYRFTKAQPVHQQQVQPRPSIIGTWGFYGQTPMGLADLGLALNATGRMAFFVTFTDANGQKSEGKFIGTWQISDNLLALTDQNGNTQRYKFRFEGDQLSVYFNSWDLTIHFQRYHPKS